MKKLFAILSVTALLGAGCISESPVVIDTDNVDEKSDLIVVWEPHPNDIVTSPLSITGEARGTWYFEASFPIELQDADGNVIAQGHAEAQANWMTEDFVPFLAELEFTAAPGVTDGVLYLRKDNPSGLPEHDDAVWMLVQFE